MFWGVILLTSSTPASTSGKGIHPPPIFTKYVARITGFRSGFSSKYNGRTVRSCTKERESKTRRHYTKRTGNANVLLPRTCLKILPLFDMPQQQGGVPILGSGFVYRGLTKLTGIMVVLMVTDFFVRPAPIAQDPQTRARQWNSFCTNLHTIELIHIIQLV